MPLTPAEKHQNRIKNHKRYNAYIPLFIANSFDQKLKEKGLTFTDWLKDSMTKFITKN